MDRVGTDLRHARAAAVAVSVAVLTTLGLPATVGAAGKRATPKHGPNLEVTNIAVSGLGSPKVVIVKSNGEAKSFHVTVTTRNVGDREAGRSHTRIELLDRFGNVVGRGEVEIGNLAPREPAVVEGTVTGVKPHLGFVTVVALADANNKVSETVERNRKTWGKLPVIAETWNASRLKAVLAGGTGGEGSETEVLPGFVFSYSHFDPAPPGRWVYTASGDINQNTTIGQAGCGGAGSGGASHTAWPSTSFFDISKTLSQYQAVVKAFRRGGL